jgi:hypothetical protein
MAEFVAKIVSAARQEIYAWLDSPAAESFVINNIALYPSTLTLSDVTRKLEDKAFAIFFVMSGVAVRHACFDTYPPRSQTAARRILRSLLDKRLIRRVDAPYKSCRYELVPILEQVAMAAKCT